MIDTDVTPIHVLQAYGSIWVTTYDGATLQRIDPDSNTVVGTVDVGDGADGLIDHDGCLWVVTDRDDSILQVDPDAEAVVASWQLDTQPHNGAFVEGRFWTAAFDDGRLLELELG